MMTINDILEIYRTAATERQKGTLFENLMMRWLSTDPRYASLFKQVWTWGESPIAVELGTKDLGIDLVALDNDGDWWAIQCKCYAEGTTIDKKDVDSFIANSGKKFQDPYTSAEVNYGHRMWISTSEHWGVNALESFEGQAIPTIRIHLHDLEISSVDWQKLYDGHDGETALQPGKQPRRDQLRVISNALAHYATGETRGKLIMACGTGKTYTSLRIAEEMLGEKSITLFLCPSIALLSQTLNAWMADKRQPIHAVCICSDASASMLNTEDDHIADSLSELPYPATTNVRSVCRQINKYRGEGGRIVIFSTYQSIGVVHDVQKEADFNIDLVICDEAHRTASVAASTGDEKCFTLVHDENYIRATRRLYMTATPKIYAPKAKAKAASDSALLYSMDDERVFGKTIDEISFSYAVQNGLLTDYKVLVLTMTENDIPKSLREKVQTDELQLRYDDTAKLIGCINGLSKRIALEDGVSFTAEELKNRMQRAIAFCSRISRTRKTPVDAVVSTEVAENMPKVSELYREQLSDEEAEKVVSVKAWHVDGSMPADERQRILDHLREDIPEGECHVVCNVQCLSEGVDVPALDAVLFLASKKSQVDIVQSVGRVMRNFRRGEGGKGDKGEKMFGYIIIPVVVPMHMSAEDALDNSDAFRPVWEILNALRSNDASFEAKVNTINLNKKKPVIVAPGTGTAFGGGFGIGAGDDGAGADAQSSFTFDWPEPAEWREMLYARMVKKVGNRIYWQNWSRMVGDMARTFQDRIYHTVVEEGQYTAEFNDFIEGLRADLNPAVSERQAIEMLAQHMIAQPIFDALFENYGFSSNNSVSKSMQRMLEVLADEAFRKDLDQLDDFYTNVRATVSETDNLAAKQRIIKDLYQGFFAEAFSAAVPQTTNTTAVKDKVIIYTPVECVDFMLRSADDLMRAEFGVGLTDEGVGILDPFTGTGTFLTRLLQIDGLIRPEDRERKYRSEIHANELLLLAYYVADANIETTFQEVDHRTADNYLTYDNICLTDTFQTAEPKQRTFELDDFFAGNTELVQQQKKANIRVIIGNPPYDVADKGIDYTVITDRIKQTYLSQKTTVLSKGSYNSYIMAFRWASDRLAQSPEGGVVAFITPANWLTGGTETGIRRCFENEFTSIYVFNLRGRQIGVKGEESRREGAKIFESGCRQPIAMTFLVRNPRKAGQKAEIHYFEVEDYIKTAAEKLQIVSSAKSVLSGNIAWRDITPNALHDWFDQRPDNDPFEALIPVAPTAKNFEKEQRSFFTANIIGVSSNRDVWVSGYNRKEIEDNVRAMLTEYEKIREDFETRKQVDPNAQPSIDKSDAAKKRIAWTVGLEGKVRQNTVITFQPDRFVSETYRPFVTQELYYDPNVIERPGLWRKVLPTTRHSNRVIAVSGDYTLMSSSIVDLHFIGDTHFFPLYTYSHISETGKVAEKNLFGELSVEGYETDGYKREDGISDWILKEVRERYGLRDEITKEGIFYYVYGILHSEEYRKRYAANLKRGLPRLPIVSRYEDFHAYAEAGRQLADLHINYVGRRAPAGVTVTGEESGNFHVEKMRYASKDDHTTIVYNDNIVISGIPREAEEYVLNGRTAIGWVIEFYRIKEDKQTGIVCDPNTAEEVKANPRYILDLLLSVIGVSVETVRIVRGLPKTIE